MVARLNQQDINLEEALKELDTIKQFLGHPEHILGNPSTKHGEIAEHMQVNFANARRAIQGLSKNHTFDGAEKQSRRIIAVMILNYGEGRQRSAIGSLLIYSFPNLSQSELADVLGFATVNRWEKGRCKLSQIMVNAIKNLMRVSWILEFIVLNVADRFLLYH